MMTAISAAEIEIGPLITTTMHCQALSESTIFMTLCLISTRGPLLRSQLFHTNGIITLYRVIKKGEKVKGLLHS